MIVWEIIHNATKLFNIAPHLSFNIFFVSLRYLSIDFPLNYVVIESGLGERIYALLTVSPAPFKYLSRYDSDNRMDIISL